MTFEGSFKVVIVIVFSFLKKESTGYSKQLSCVVQILCIVRGDGVRKTIIIQTYLVF